jgi:peptidoglycan/LPS O-acetylase OafA/YrhL
VTQEAVGGRAAEGTPEDFDPSTRLGFRPALNGVRAAAVIPVVAGHTVSSLAPGGFSGVRLFFVLSGFLITTLLFEEWATQGLIRLGAFYTRRALRLLPALFFILLVDMVLVALLDGGNAVRHHVPTVFSVMFYFANWRQIPLNGGREFGHLWSLSVEEQFYLLWPLGLFLLLRFFRVRTVIIVAACCAVASWLISELLALQAHGSTSVTEFAATQGSRHHEFFGTDAVAYAILTGCVVALLRSSGRIRQSDRYRSFIAAAGTLGFVFYAIYAATFPARGHREVGLLILTGAFALLILCVVDCPKAVVTQLLSTAPLQLIGRVSYGLYLWHFVILYHLHKHMPHAGVAERTFIAAVLTTAAVAFSYNFIEQPALRWKRRLHVEARTA